ncbi:MAG TPA: hypothetical protein VHZ30_01645 [Verrucomicrobiae bacterium]|jgi:hypothetical protein|nr:hypothetical protein [Verrucomicrobiae bacterium]
MTDFPAKVSSTLTESQRAQLSRIRARARRIIGNCRHFFNSPEVAHLSRESVARLARIEVDWASDPEAVFEVLKLCGWAEPGDRAAIDSLTVIKSPPPCNAGRGRRNVWTPGGVKPWPGAS